MTNERLQELIAEYEGHKYGCEAFDKLFALLEKEVEDEMERMDVYAKIIRAMKNKALGQNIKNGDTV